MRRCFPWFLLVPVIGFLTVSAQDNPAGNIVQEFSGSGTTTTGFFKIQDRWEVRWNARQVVSVAVMSSDGTIVAGAAGVLRGSLFVPMGGQYYFKISDGSTTTPRASTNAPSGASPSKVLAPDNSAVPAPVVSWHLQVVELGTSVTSNQALTVYTPYFMVPDSAVTPVATPPEPPTPALTAEQAKSVVSIVGEKAQGTGFLLRSSEGTFVATRLYLLAANPNIKIFTNTGAQITPLSLKGAVDRGLAMYSIQDDHYSYLPLAKDPMAAANEVDTGDQVITPDPNNPTNALAGKPGRITAVSPERIDFDMQLDSGSNGSPIIHVKNGNAIAMVVPEKQVEVSESLAKAWPANPAPGSFGIIPYYGLRLTGVQSWQTYDTSRFLAETLFLKQFHEDTRRLDSYLNGRRRRVSDVGDSSGPPDNQYYLTNPKLHAAQDTYRQLASGADQNQRLEAAQELLFDLEGFADTNVSALQEMNLLYAYDQSWAQEELAYRKALKKQLDDLSNSIVRLDNIARSH